MAKSDLNPVSRHSIATKQPTLHPEQQTPRTPLENVRFDSYDHPSVTPRPLADVTEKLASCYSYAGLRSSSPPPSLDNLQPLEALTLHNVDENTCKGGYISTSVDVLECKHWLEIEDKQHRYGTYLRPYYDMWLSSGSLEPFFTWLDNGPGRNADASKAFRKRPNCVTRAILDRTRVHYCSRMECEKYRVVIRQGRLVWANEDSPNGNGKYGPVDTESREDKWIFVIDESGNCYVNRKVKGRFHHSSFVSGRPVRAAGRIIVEGGHVVSIGPNSGHYLTTWEQLQRAVREFFGQSLHDVSSLCARGSLDITSTHAIGDQAGLIREL